LATARGIELSVDDQARAWVIERLMCSFVFSAAELVERFGAAGQTLLCEASSLAISEAGRLLLLDGDNFVVPEESRPLVRTVAAKFDKYLRTGNARHSAAV
jgi:oxygen-independent coproporphyrinogen-3 oxidase